MFALGDLVTLIILLILPTLAAPREWLAHPGKHVCGLILLYVSFLVILPLLFWFPFFLIVICHSESLSTDGRKGFGSCAPDLFAFSEWFECLAAFGEILKGVDELIVDWLLLLIYLAPLLVLEPSRSQIPNRVQDADQDDRVHENDEEPSQEEIPDCTPIGSQDDGPHWESEEEPQQGQISMHSPIHGYNDLDVRRCVNNAEFTHITTRWALDSGSETHICNNLSAMKNLIADPKILHGLTGSVVCPLVGDVDLELQSPYGGNHKITLMKCIFYPQLPFNIFSVSRLTREHNLYFTTRDCTIRRIENGEIVGSAPFKDNMYMVRSIEPIPLEEGSSLAELRSQPAYPRPTTEDPLRAIRWIPRKRKYGDYNLADETNVLIPDRLHVLAGNEHYNYGD